MDDLRAEARRKKTGGILYSYPEEGGSPFETSSGLLSNVSETGACIYTQEALEEGSVISVYGKSLSFQEPKKASVVWCNRIYEDLYMVGLLFQKT